jgi:hypothetical protein
VVQGAHAEEAKPLGSIGMRDVLSSPATGTPQGGNQHGAIGVMPDLEAVFKRLWDEGKLPRRPDPSPSPSSSAVQLGGTP